MSNGIIRRIDSLGRVVIPIHIRKKLNLYENDNVEIQVNDEKQIIISKFSTLRGNIELFNHIVEALYKTIRGTILITDSDVILSCYGDKRNIYKPYSNLTNETKNRLSKEYDLLQNNAIIEGANEELNNVIVPIIGLAGKKIGSIIYIYNGNLLENNRNILSSYAIFISEMMR